MKILQVIPRFNPNLGGGVHVVYGLSKYLSRNGHDVTIITTKVGLNTDSVKSIEEEGVHVISFDYIFDWHLFIPSPKMKKWLEKNIVDFDVVHLNGSRSYQNNIVYKYCKKHKVPYILQPHGSILRIIEAKSLKYFYDQIWGYRIYKNASKVIALNKTEIKSCTEMRINRDKIVEIPNGVDPEKFSKLPKRGQFRKKYNLSKDEKIVLYIGRLHKSKKIDLLIDAFNQVMNEIDDATLIVIGPDGGDKKNLEKLAEKYNIKNKINFTGLINEKEKIEALVDSDVFVTPRFYGFPITFAESCACGLPIITTNDGESLEWIDKNVGYVAEGNSKSITNRICNMFEYEMEKALFRSNCIKLFINKFNWGVISKEIEDIYKFK